MDGQGLAQRTAWAGAGDGVLAFDADGDGKIARANEIVFTLWDPTAKTDFEALRTVFDTNRNGLLDAGDARFASFGAVVDGRFRTLAEWGIVSIGLQSDKAGYAFSDASGVIGESRFTRADGSTGRAADAVLKADTQGALVSRATTQDSAGATTTVTTARGRDGALTAVTTRVVQADGSSERLDFDDDGDGVLDRTQTITRATNNGRRSETTREFDQAGRLVAQSVLTRAAGRTRRRGYGFRRRVFSGGVWVDSGKKRRSYASVISSSPIAARRTCGSASKTRSG
jgi:hypothetical protein